jgi:orotidine-5'-phosphate decarboxylase
MNRNDLLARIREKRSYLCIGLDPDLKKIPAHLHHFPDPLFEFNKQIIDATHDLCVAYKANTAFYEARGVAGWQSLEKTLRHIPEEHFAIADAKRGDIGNTSLQYARAFFEALDFDAVTVAPYMGADSVRPFLNFPGKWVILLALTSNEGSRDFQLSPLKNGRPLYERVLRRALQWGSPEELMFVVGATHPQQFNAIRRLIPGHFILAPGIGAQGGDLEAVSRHALNDRGGLLVNSSRQILYGSQGEDFAEKARQAALALQQQMARLLDEEGVFG